MTYIRVDRWDATGRSLADGPHQVGHIEAGRVVFRGFPDAASATTAARVAERVARQWARGRAAAPFADDVVVSPLADGHGFECRVPDTTWRAILLQLAQRVHASTDSLRQPRLKPAA